MTGNLHHHVRNLLALKQTLEEEVDAVRREMEGLKTRTVEKTGDVISTEVTRKHGFAVWSADVTGVYDALQIMSGKSVSGLEHELERHPLILKKLLSRLLSTEVNPAALQLFRAPDADTLFHSVTQILTAESRKLLVRVMLSLANGEQGFTGETTLLRLDGIKIPVMAFFFFHSGDHDLRNTVCGFIDLTRQKEVEEELALAEKRLYTVLPVSPDLIFVLNDEGYCLDFYAAHPEKLYFTRDQVIHRHLHDFLPQSPALEQVEQTFYHVVRSREPATIEYDVRHPGGLFYYENRFIAAGKDENLVIVTDITRLKLPGLSNPPAHLTLADLMASSAIDAILVIDPHSYRILDANPKALGIYGYSKDQLLRLTLMDLMKFRSLGTDLIRKVLLNQQFSNFETIQVDAGGKTLFMLVNGSLVDMEGKPALLLSNHDITDLKWAEKVRNATYRISELALLTRNLDDLFREIHEVIRGLMHAENCYFALLNQEDGSISFPYFVDTLDQAPEPRKLKRGLTEYILRTGKPLLLTPELLHKMVSRGEVDILGTMTYNWMGVPLKTREKAIGVLAVQSYTQDVRYNEADEEILSFVSDQVAMAIERKVNEERLIKAREAAEESSLLKSTMLINLSHEFRTPMNAILNYASMLKEELAGHPGRAKAETILTSGRRLLTTLDAIMYLAQIETRRFSLEILSHNLGKVIHETVGHFGTEASGKGLSFGFNMKESVYASCDKTLINLVISYLLENAVKFTSTGGVSVTLRSTVLSGKPWAEIEVKDTGIGMSGTEIEMIFQEYRQLSTGYSRSYEGSGLGLVLCKRMAELMNGSILVDSEPGKGSTFILRLPGLANLSGEGKSPDEKPFRKSQEENISGRREAEGSRRYRALVVEDNQVNMELTVMFLKDLCHIDKAGDGLKAIRMARDGKYDVILMDINLGPGINGLETTAEIRKIKGYEQTPVIAVTGYTMSGDRETMLQGGCTHYLPKPFDKKSLVNIVREALGELT